MPHWSKNTRIFLPTSLILVLIVFLFLIETKKVFSNENRLMAVMGPLIMNGTLDEASQQILFDSLRENLLKRFMLVSHVVVDSIRERGFQSIDIENCRSSKCVNTILDFLDELEKRYQTRHFFQFSIRQTGSETHFSLKYSDLRFPEIIRHLKTASCKTCSIIEMRQALDQTTMAMLNLFPPTTQEAPKFVDQDAEQLETEAIIETDQKQQDPLTSPAPTAEGPSFPTPAITEKTKQSETPKLQQTPDVQVKKEELLEKPEKKTQPEPVEVALPEPRNPYEIARDEYNAFLASQLLDITYSLQVFRIGMHVVIQLEIDEDGNLVNQMVVQSSGSKDFDETAMLGVEEIELKKLPDPLNEYSSYKVNLRIQNYQ